MKTLDNFKVITKSGQTYDMADDLNVLVRSFIVSSPNPEIEYEKMNGQHGVVRMGKTWGQRKISAICSVFAVDSYDISLLRSEVFKVLMAIDEFFIISDADPGKRWLVEVGSEWAPEKIGTYGEFTLNFVSHSPFAQSVGTTLDPMTFDSEMWQIGQGLTIDETDYSHTVSAFSIFNAGDEVINPRFYPLVIKFKGASTNLKIKNTTTGDEWSYTGTTTASDTLEIKRTRSLKNGVVNIFTNTNRKLITLATGWNDFTITGASGSFTIDFDFRFYYL